MKTFFVRGFLAVAVVFVGLFGLRFGYGVFTLPDGEIDGRWDSSDSAEFRSDFELSRKNYASNKLKSGVPVDSGLGALDQKYEKIGLVAARTSDFMNDEARVRGLVASYAALVQFEQLAGLSGNRLLQLGIGVHPDRFDNFLAAAKTIGTTTSLRVQKIDKTNEFKDLKVKRASLEKTKEALAALKGREGRIEELISLENKIMEIDREIQTLGVQLGDFDQENEFCTVKIALFERGLRVRNISLIQRSKVALEWAARHFLGLLMFTFAIALTLLVVAILLEKTRMLQTKPPFSDTSV
jgi:hypothetical protein